MGFAFEDASRVEEDVERHLDDQDSGPEPRIMQRLIDHARTLAEDDPVHDVDELSRIITAWTFDTSPEALAQAVELLRDLGDRPCDPLTAVMLARRGINPYALLMMEASHVGTSLPKNVTLVSPDERVFLELVPLGGPRRGPAWDHATIALAPGVWWTGTSMDLWDVPSTVATAAEGMPLRDVVSHPEIDPLGPLIAGVQSTSSGHVEFRTDRTPDVLPWRDTIHLILRDRAQP